jgi:hypothetical protein
VKTRVQKLSNVLKDVHKRFLEQERIQAEQFFQRKIAPFEFLLMLTQDKNFEWLMPFSALIADIDAYADEAEMITKADLVSIRDRIDYLLKDAESSVVDRYNYHLGRDAVFIMLHASLKKELSEFVSQ